ncbi:hypothetical protein MBAV_001593 [Candidatus Magnetobacterium bavaricum]|uniref:Uncharacterized protein n=1 Tax=Candidatus Magnetobacterium bavaricum TaxID=29290 RepID=A0A0F3GWE0_9BACT|nr:hypothetical protein MBAV_001593 [Candidatus Magnetobacterium bavaricum]
MNPKEIKNLCPLQFTRPAIFLASFNREVISSWSFFILSRLLHAETINQSSETSILLSMFCFVKRFNTSNAFEALLNVESNTSNSLPFTAAGRSWFFPAPGRSWSPVPLVSSLLSLPLSSISLPLPSFRSRSHLVFFAPGRTWSFSLQVAPGLFCSRMFLVYGNLTS